MSSIGRRVARKERAMDEGNVGIPVQFFPPESLEGTKGVVWLARDGRRTSTQVATNVRYALRMTPNRKNMLGHTAILPPTWSGTLKVARKDSYLKPNSEIILTMDDGRQVSGFIRSLRGFRTQTADIMVNGWVEDWV
jgi:hypothetical protein